MKNKKLIYLKFTLLYLLIFIVVVHIPFYIKEWQINSIKVGETTRSDVESVFGNVTINPITAGGGVGCEKINVTKALSIDEADVLALLAHTKEVRECLEVSPNSKVLNRCSYWGNSYSILRLRVEDSIELYYDENEVVCRKTRWGL